MTEKNTEAPPKIKATADLTPKEAEARAEAITSARTDALSELREAHRDELNASIKAKVNAAGFEWEPRPTEAEKAKAKIRQLLKDNPELADEIEFKG